MKAFAGKTGLFLGLLLGISGFLLVCALWWGRLRFPPCFFRKLTGLPCPTCGGLHALEALKSAHLLEALRANPLVTLGFFGGFLYTIYAGGVVFLNVPRFAPPAFLASPKTLRFVFFWLVGLSWLWGLIVRFTR